jgi:hypothetical protein
MMGSRSTIWRDDHTMNDTPAEHVQYEVEETRRGTWRRFRYPDGRRFEEYVSYCRLFGLPLVHTTRGLSPETSKHVVAHGVVAVGRRAHGVVAIGQFARGFVAIGQIAIGFVAVGQMAVGVLFGLGQLATGVVAIGQLSIAGIFALGQLAYGYIAVAQVGTGAYVFAQQGFGAHVWDMSGAAPEAVDFFQPWLPQ